VIGNGMAGARLIEDVLARGGSDRFDITVFGDEPHGNYNRILLSGVLAGTHDAQEISINPLEWYAANGVTLHAGARVEQIDLTGRRVSADGGVAVPFDLLVLATGSRPFMPPIAGLRSGDGTLRPRAFVFRTLDDCRQISECARQSTSVAVIGGGLLGLEAARGLLNFGLDVHVVHLMDRVMDVQLDAAGAGILQRQLERSGLKMWLGKTTERVLGGDRISGLQFSDGSTLSCDMIVVAAGIRPSIALAQQAGLRVNRGIVVGDDLACPDAPGVYAVGECAEHRGQLYGLVAPLWDQTRVLADRLTGRNAAAVYEGSRPSTRLKVAGIDLAVMGIKDAVEEDDEVVSYAEPTRGIYKKLIVRNNMLAGAIVLGDSAVVPSMLQAFAESRRLIETRSELLFTDTWSPRPAPRSAESLPDDSQICDCNGVSKARIIEAVLSGARSVLAVSDLTRACTGCGTCRPEVERIVTLACQGLAEPALLESAAALPAPVLVPPAAEKHIVVTLNKIERLKKEKDGLDIVDDVPRLAAGEWQAIDDADRERLKWAGVFFRRQTPGRFMMRVRIANGLTNAEQMATLADLSAEFGTGLVDITTRQQVQLRGFAIEHVPAIWHRLDAVGLVSLQTGMDNVRNVIGCAAAGLTGRELFDASPVAREFTDLLLRNKAFTNLPRKFNVGITGCTEHCTHADTQDLALTPALASVDGGERHGFNVAIGGKIGSGGCRVATPLDVFVEPERAAALCSEIAFIFRDYGSRAARNKARLAFLVEEWGADRFRRELQARVAWTLHTEGRDARSKRVTDHLGIVAQKQAGLNYVGLAAATGRVAAAHLREVARVASAYGDGELRLTTAQNIIIPNVPDERLPAFVQEPVLAHLPYDPAPALRGLVACTGIDYCHFSLIETKELALRTAGYLAGKLPADRRFTTHWSGCPAGCGNHPVADVGLLGKNIRVNGELIEAVDVFVGGSSGPDPKAGTKVLEDVPCDELPMVLERLVPFIIGKRSSTATVPATVVARPQWRTSSHGHS
jgi:NAD(P)H-dependent nitrite reductase large subunit